MFPLRPISPSIPDSGSSKTACKEGFALVIALSLMAFILLLLLSLTALVQVETQSSEVSTARMEAEQNALLGLQQALGELQMAAGPDQRVTVSSEMFDNTPDAATIDGVSTRHYTGVFRAHDTAQPLEDFRATQDTPAAAIKWLASSEDILTDPVAADPSAYSPTTGTISIAKVYQADTDTLEDILVGKVSVDDGAGSYAWWVADEGVKAKFNTADPGIGLTDTEGPFEQDKLDIMQARQSNFAHVSGGFDQEFADLISGDELPKLNSAQGFNLISPDWGEWMMPPDPSDPNVSANVNADVTLFSRGVPVDVTQGRLKEDLTVYLETGEGLDDNDHIVRGSSDDDHYEGPDFGASLTGNPVGDNMPRFGLLRSWHDLGKDFGDNGTARNQPQTNTQHGLHPTVMRAGYSLSIGRVGNPIQDPNKPDNMLVNLQVMAFVRVALMNPYNFALPAEEYLFEISFPDRLYLQWRKGTGNPGVPPAPLKSPVSTGADADYAQVIDFLADGVIQPDLNYDWLGNKPWIRMTLDTGHYLLDGNGMLPGEVLNFSPEAAQEPLTDALYVDQKAYFYRSGLWVNYTDPVQDKKDLDISNFFVMGPQVQVSVPKSQAWYPETPKRDDYWYTLRYQLDTLHNLEHGLSWRLSRLSGGEPTLLSSKDPTKTTKPVIFRPGGYDWEGHGNGASKNWDGIKQLNPTPSNHFHRIHTDMHDYWHAAARAGGARQGGDRRNAVRNPRGGILRDDLDLSDWGEADHRISVYSDESFEHYWNPARWRRETDVETGNAGTVEGYVLNPKDNSTANSTGTRYTMFDFPRRFGPITSLGQLQHANLNPFGFGSAYQVGFSRAPYHVDRDSLVESAETSLPNERIDLPFMVNASLWDRFYLSTIPQTGNLSLDSSNLSVLANNRHVLVPDANGAFPDEDDLRDSETGFAQSAAHIQVDGAFNINSVSVDAWEAVLLQAAGKTITTERDGILNDTADETFVAFPRFPDPVYGADDNDVFDALDAQDREQYAGMFVTDRDDIRILAETIVAEIKRRGPFLSLADFINRRQIADARDLDLDYQGLMGTLDAAIMRASQNQDVLNYQQIFSRTQSWNQNLNPNNPGEAPSYSDDVESALGVPRGHQSTALEGNSANLTQGDVLQVLGAQLSARSDTFVIRSYGEATDPITGEINSSARCEAVVQRIAEPVEFGDSLVAPTGDFGRRFVVVAFRWLDEGT